MPTYSIKGPDGNTYSIDGPEGATREQVIYMIERRLREQSKPMGFTGSFMKSAQTLGDLPEAAKFAVADSTKRQPRKEFLDASAPKRDTTSWDEVNDLASFWEFSKELAGGSAGFIAPAAAAAKAASYLPVVGPYARGIGLATYGLGYLVDQLGTQAQVQQEAIDKGEAYAPTSVARAASGAALSTALDVVQLGQFSKVMSKFPFMGKLMGDMGEQGAKEAEEQLVDAYLAGTLKPSGAVMKGVAKGLAFEIPQEIAQTAIDRLQSSQALTGEDAMKAYKEAAIGAAILGGPMGGAEGALGYYGAKKKAMEPEPEVPPLTATLRPQAPPPFAPRTPAGLGLPPPEAPPAAGAGTPPPGGGPGGGPGAGPGGPGTPPPPPRPFDDDDLNIARETLLNNKGKKRLTPGGMRYALNAAMRKAGRDGKMARMDEILRHLTIDGFIRPDADGNVTFGYPEPEEQTFEGEAEEVTPTGPEAPTLGIEEGEPVPPNPLDVLSAQRASDASLPMPPRPVVPVTPEAAAPGEQGEFDFGEFYAGDMRGPPRQPGPTPQGPQGVAPTQGEFDFGAAAAAEAATPKQRETLSLRKRPAAPAAPAAVAPVVEPVVEEEPTLDENEEMTGLDEMDFADAATANLEPEGEQTPFDPVEVVNAARQKAYDLYPGEGVPARAARSAFMRGYSSSSGETDTFGTLGRVNQVLGKGMTKNTQKAYEEGQTFAQQQAQTQNPPQVPTSKGVPDTGGARASVPESVPAAPTKPRTTGKGKPAGVDTAGQAASGPATGTPKSKPPLTPADKARIAATKQLTDTFRYLVKTNRITPEEAGRIGTTLILANTNPDFDYKAEFPAIRKFLMEASSRAGTDNIETDIDEADIEEAEGQQKDVSREYNEEEEIDYEDAFEDERGPKELRFSRTADERWYYSALKRFFETVKQAKATAKQWLGMLSNAPGIKPEEVEWTGIEEYLNLMAAKGDEQITKEEIVAFLDQKGIEIEEVEFNYDRKYQQRVIDAQNKSNTFIQRMKRIYGQDIFDTVEDKITNTSRLSPEHRKLYEDITDEVEGARADVLRKMPRYQGIRTDRDGGTNPREFILRLVGHEKFRDPRHYKDINNIVAFIRVDDRIDEATGKRVLFVQEIQSDWGQKLHRVQSELGLRLDNDGPFVNSTESWTSLALKKLMVVAVNQGYDQVAFVNGAMTSERYGRTVSYYKLNYRYNPDTNTYNLDLYIPALTSEPYTQYENVEEKDLLKHLGDEEVVKKLVDETREREDVAGSALPSRTYTIYPGRVINIPSHGMRGYYDNIVPKVLKKLAAKLGGVVRKETDYFSSAHISSESYEDEVNQEQSQAKGGADINVLDVDQKLIDNVQKQVPLFRAAGKGSMLAKDVQGIVDSVIKGWTNAPTVKVVQSIADLPAKLRNSITFGVDGFYADGTVYLIADHLGSAERVQSTLFHESLAHFGLREEFGNKLDPLLDSIYKTNPAMRAAVDKWLKDNPDTYADLSADEQRRAAMEEVFAEQSESGPIKNMGLRAALNRIVSFIKDFLRQMGLDLAYSDADVANILAKAHNRVISGGKKGVEAGSIRFRRTRVPPGANETAEETIARLQKELDAAYSADSALSKAIKFRFTQKGFEWLVKRIQNDRRPAKQLEEDLRASGDLIVGENGFNNLYSLLTLSAQKAFHYMTTRLNIPLMDMKESIREYAAANKMNMDAALARLHTYVMALHEHERRMAKYVMNVPLNNVTRVRIPGLPDEGTFADHRTFIMRQLYGNPRMSKAQAKEYRVILDAIIAGRYGQAVDANGVSGMRDARGNSMTGLSLDPMSDDYRVIGGYSQAQFAEFRRQYQAEKPMVDKIIQHMKKVQKETVELNKQANYWSPQVDNLQNFYGWENYVPFKSRKESRISADDDKLDLSSDRLGVGGYEYLDYAQSFSGRTTDSENPLLQVMMEAASASMRAGRHGVTQSIVNLKEQGHIKARKLGTIKFEDRYNGDIDMKPYEGENVVFHYMPDGVVEIWAMGDKEIAESVRRAYQTPNPIWQATNRVTSFFGHLHTRYNPAFHIYNYIRDSLTNAWLIGSDVSKEARSRYLDQIAQLTVNGGLIKAGKVSRLYANSDIAGIEAMWKNPDGSVKDQFVKDIYDFMRLGGRTAFINALSMQKEGDQLLKELRGSGALDKALDVRDAGLKWVDIAGDMFELTSRAAAFSAVKSDFRAKGLSEEQANIEAAAFAKGLANFEQVGLWGQKLGAFFMFFRPSATGAVRAIDSLRPLMQSEASYLATVTASAKNTPEKKQKLLADFRRRRQNAGDALKMLTAAGAALYILSTAMAEDDDAERNEVATDDKALWTRNLRLPLKWLGYEGDNPWINIPWGFGFGAFAAGGAQTMALLTGGQSVKEFAGNMVNISLDSFLPIPVSRINPFDNPGAWLVSSAMPSLARPIVDFQMNIDSLGRQIYNNRQTKYGDAYTSGMNTPEHINDLARFMADNFDVDVAPNSLNFWASNYFDAISRVIGGAYDTTLAIKGEKDPTIKGMLLPLSSFMGAKSNYDGRKFAEMQKEANDYIAKLNRLENTNPERLQEFLEENPNAYEIKYIYNKVVNGELRKIAERRKAILSDPNLTPKDRREMATELNTYYNASKRNLMETMKTYGLEY